MTIDDQDRTCLLYRLIGTQEAVSSYGHPYIRRLCYEIPQEWNNGKLILINLIFKNAFFTASPNSKLQSLVNNIIQYCLDHNAEAEACDLLMEMDSIGQIIEYVTESIHERACLYLTR